MKVTDSITTLGNEVRLWGACAALALMLQGTDAGELVRISQMLNYSTGPLGQAENVEGWNNTSGNITVTAGSGSLDGTSLGLTSSRGDLADINATQGLNVYNLFAASGQFRPDVRRNLYYSFLYRFNDAADVSDTSEIILQANRQNSGSQFTLQGVARSIDGKLQIGVAKNGGTPAFAPRQINPGETVFVVFRHQIIPPAGAEDVVDVWVNPPSASFNLDETVTPPPTPDATALDGTEDTSNTGPGRFYLASGANAAFDELRIGTNWADVTPSAAVCDPASVTQNPVDASVTAGIPATFSVKAAGSSPLFQWQSSSDGGTNWADVTGGTGATLATYTTPFTTVADTGRKFRAIVTVTCGPGSSATSAVATLTVAPATPTPSGLVLSDTWTNDLSVNTPPVTTNNSVWYASSSGSLYIDTGNNTMVASPLAGSSTLWVGYFTENTNLPVHLEVGRMLRAMLQFKASGVSATDGNLRIGLFDYADGSARLDRDGFGSGSSGNGENVRGYMVGINFSSTFSATSPLTLYARKGLDSLNLMGSTGDYQSLGSGPGGLQGTAGIQDNTEYTLELSIERTNTVGVVVTASITGGDASWTHSVADATYNYHRFDAIGIRPNTQETTATWMEVLQFKVEVVETASPPPVPIPLDVRLDGPEAELSWTDPAFLLEAASQAGGPYTEVTGATSPHRVSTATGQQFFRLRARE